MQNILVSGGSGFIGYHLVKKLLHLDCKVTVIDNTTERNERYSFDPLGKKVVFYEEDTRDMEAVLDIVRHEEIDTCIHLAAKISVAESMRNPFETMDVNVNGTLSILNACAANKVENFVFASSAAVYGEPRSVPIPESHILNPSSPYGASKVAGEALVTSFQNSGKIPNAIVLRFFNVFGPGQSSDYAGVITRFADRLSRGLPPIIFGDGHQTRDFIHVDDIANAIIHAVKAKISGIYNLGTGIPLSLNDLARMMAITFNLKIEPIHVDPQPGDVRYSCADISEIRRVIPFSPMSLLQSMPSAPAGPA